MEYLGTFSDEETARRAFDKYGVDNNLDRPLNFPVAAAGAASVSPATPNRYTHLLTSLGASNVAKLGAARILVIGAGGIGCELLKNLVLSGFKSIETIDLDTIDFSNLNRQFLFRKRHVNRPKADVAREAVKAFNPDVEVVAHHGNVKAADFGRAYFEKFTLVLNALDNVSARRHVNRLCLQVGVPLIDAGTQGDLGQVKVIRGKWSACYECEPPPKPIAYALCTVVSTPRKPVHCIEYAKQLYLYLFGGTLRSTSQVGIWCLFVLRAPLLSQPHAASFHTHPSFPFHRLHCNTIFYE